MKNFYLVESFNIIELSDSEQKLLEQYLSIYHDVSSTFIDKVSAINKSILHIKNNHFRFIYATWLLKLINKENILAYNVAESKKIEDALATCYKFLGIKHYYDSNYSEAVAYYKKALAIRKEQNNKKVLSRLYNNIALCYYKQGDNTSALHLYEQAIQLLIELKDKDFLTSVYTNIAQLMRKQGKYKKAINYLFEGLKMSENNDKNKAHLYHDIGILFIFNDENKTGLDYCFKALKLAQKIGNKYREAGIYQSIGWIYETEKKNRIALEYYHKALAIETWQTGLADLYQRIGSVYEVENQIELALENYHKALLLCEKQQHKSGNAEILCKVGLLELKKENIGTATQQIENAFALAQELDYPNLTKKVAYAKIQVALLNGDYKLAYEMEKLRSEMKEKIENKNNQNELLKQEFKYEYEIAMLKKNMEIEYEKKNVEQAQKQNELLLLKNDELDKKNKIIEKQIDEMNVLIQKLQESNENLEQFAFVAAHDLKAPLRNIQMFSKILHKKNLNKLPKSDLELFRFITNGCVLLKKLIDGLLEYSRISNIKYTPEVVDIKAVVSAVQHNLINNINDANVVIHISNDLGKAMAQKELLFQVFLNFINNAIKFRKKDENIRPTIWISSELQENNQLKICIKDNGIGIAPEYQKEIFGIFRKLHHVSEYEGNGIGLSICKKIIEHLGGNVWVKSEVNVGTSFLFTLKQSA